ncbi:hypothetical protein GJAV_G00206350 [Gymnothorax javanicus]|nr:hypothetical protein GJAV_G00206350 [Gymnothorax javanicus]
MPFAPSLDLVSRTHCKSCRSQTSFVRICSPNSRDGVSLLHGMCWIGSRPRARPRALCWDLAEVWKLAVLRSAAWLCGDTMTCFSSGPGRGGGTLNLGCGVQPSCDRVGQREEREREREGERVGEQREGEREQTGLRLDQ